MPKVLIFAGANGSGKTTFANRSAYNFWNKYRFYASKWSIINNNQLESESIAVGSNGNFNVMNDAEFNIFEEMVKHG